jgi:hypothetical protein
MEEPLDPVERQIREAMERGEFDHLPGTGRPLDLGDDDPDWWARRRLAELRRLEAQAELVARLTAGVDALWTEPDPHHLRRRVSELNARIEEANRCLDPALALPAIDHADAERRWRAMWRLRSGGNPR